MGGRIVSLALAVWLVAGAARAQESALGLGLDEVPFQAIELQDGFWMERQRALVRTTLPALLDEAEATGLVANFRIAAGSAKGEHRGGPTADAALYQLLEAAAVALHSVPDAELAARVGALAELVAAAQREDGSVDTHVAVAGSGRPWRDLEHGRELYGDAHLIEAAIALADSGTSEALLPVAVRLADAICARFDPAGPKKELAPPGYPAIERALVRLYRKTGEFRYQELAQRLLEGRGVADGRKLYGELALDAVPLLKSRAAEGDALRGLLLFTGLADLARATAYEDQYKASLTLYEDVSKRHGTLLGGVGSMAADGAFAGAHEQPLDGPGSPARSAAAFARWSREMLLMTAHGTYATARERALYAGVVGASALEEPAFLDALPLAADRAAWRPGLATGETAADLCRAIAGVTRGALARNGDALYVGAWLPCSTTLPLERGDVRVTIETDYPRSGEIVVRFDSEWSRDVSLHVLIPGWCTGGVTLGVNEPIQTVTVDHGPDAGTYLAFQRAWEPGDRLLVTLPMEPRRVRLSEEVAAARGQVALARGPLVYCFEACDQELPLESCYLPPDAELREEWRPDLFGGVHVLHADGFALALQDGERAAVPVELTAVPYHGFGRREPGAMRVFLPEGPQGCTQLEQR